MNSHTVIGQVKTKPIQFVIQVYKMKLTCYVNNIHINNWQIIYILWPFNNQYYTTVGFAYKLSTSQHIILFQTFKSFTDISLFCCDFFISFNGFLLFQSVISRKLESAFLHSIKIPTVHCWLCTQRICIPLTTFLWLKHLIQSWFISSIGNNK